jgi:hypothetical protein
MGNEDPAKLVKTGYFLTVQQREWLRRLAFDRRVTASQIVREILNGAMGSPSPTSDEQQAEVTR